MTTKILLDSLLNEKLPLHPDTIIKVCRAASRESFVKQISREDSRNITDLEVSDAILIGDILYIRTW